MRQHAQRLVELLGGSDIVRTAVDRLYQRLLADPDLLAYFDGVDTATLRAHMTASLVLVLDAPDDTTTFAREANRLQDAHAHLDVTDDAFDQTAGHLLDVLTELEVDPDLVDDAIIKIAALRPHIVRTGPQLLGEIATSPASSESSESSESSASPETLQSDRLTLEPLRVEHAEEMATVLSDPALYAYIGGRPEAVPELRARYARQLAGPRADRGEVWLNWVVRRRGDGQAVGTMQATVRSDADGRVAAVAWVIGRSWQGRGYAREAARATTDLLALDEIHRLEAYIHPGHLASERVAADLGMRPTKTLVDGERRWATPHRT